MELRSIYWAIGIKGSNYENHYYKGDSETMKIGAVFKEEC